MGHLFCLFYRREQVLRIFILKVAIALGYVYILFRMSVTECAGVEPNRKLFSHIAVCFIFKSKPFVDIVVEVET